ncbi:MAG: 5'-methylthioadenosine/adenosylhomocysteine nucleosidase [Clostridiales bacterium]|nr:5'-methylthioadenosine/adenosylhomocysteine nucleosidase [Clostridiales bacterium]
MIGIIGAMAVEVERLVEMMTDRKEETISSVTYHTGKIEGLECVVAQCGVGKVAAAVCAQTMVLIYRPRVLINVGVAGGIGRDVHIGDVVVSRGLVQHDMDTSALGEPKGMISGLNRVVIPSPPELVEKAARAAAAVYGRRVHVGIIATGDQFISDAETLKRIAAEFDASACEMEGGSIAQVCFVNGIDFVVIRAVSDNADEEASVDFTAFAAEEAHKSAELIAALLPQLADS